MKKWFTVFCSLLCAFCLAACGSASASDIEKAEQKEKIREYKIETLLSNVNFYVSLLQYLDDTQYAIISNYNNSEIESYIYSEYQANVDGHGLATALESFHLSKATTGAVRMNDEGSPLLSEINVEENKNQLIVHAKAECEKKTADVELIFSNDLFLTLEGGSLNARSSMGELMEKAALNTLIGMGTVFIVLILISLIIACFGLIPKIQASFAKKEQEKEVNTEGINNAVTQINQQEAINEEVSDDTELVAVIAAAIAAFEGSTNTEGFVVRSIRRRQ